MLERKKTFLESSGSVLEMKSTKLGIKLVAIVLVCLLIPLGLIYYIIQSQVKSILADQISIINEKASSAVSAEVSKFVTQAETLTLEMSKSNIMSLFLAGIGDLIDGDLQNMQAKNPWIRQIEMATASGQKKIYPSPEGEVQDLLEASWYTQTVEREDMLWFPAINKSENFRIAVPIKYSFNDETIGALSIVVDMEYFSKLLQQYSIENGSMHLINKTGAVLASDRSSEVDDELFDTHNFFTRAFENEEQVSGNFHYAGEKRLTYVKQIPQLRSVVLVQLPEKLAFSSVTGLLINMAWILLAMLAIVFIVIFVLSRMWITNPVSTLVRSAEAIAGGDLQEKITVKTKDEIGMLGRAFNRMSKNLRDLIEEIRKKAADVAQSSAHIHESTAVSARIAEQVTSSIQQVAAGAEHQSTFIEEVNGKMVNLSNSISGLTKTSKDVEEIAYETREKANLGVNSMKRVVEQMDAIQTSITESTRVIGEMTKAADEISTFVNIIDNIANQTNLLALNAAIEAARAGEEGRGFAVVAGEIRVLAEEVSRSAGKIRQLVQTTQVYSHKAAQSMEEGATQISTGQSVVGESGAIFTEIFTSFEKTLTAIQMVNEMITAISRDTTQIVEGAEKISEIAEENAAAAQEVAASTEEQAAAIEEITELAEKMADLSKALENMVQRFKI